MALETATYLDDLVPSNPSATDLLGQGDDHIRLIKSVLQSTFPNLSGPMTLDQDELNELPAAVATVAIPVGVITAWYGAAVDCPDGWAICNGDVVPRSDLSGNITTPNLIDRVIMSAGTNAVGSTGGASTSSVSSSSAGSHTHSVSGGGHGHPDTSATAGHSLSTAQMPAHSHGSGVGDNQAAAFTRGSITPGGTSTGVLNTDAGAATYEGITETVGSGDAHQHGISFSGTDGTHSHTLDTVAAHTHSVTVSTYQPAMHLYFIMKV